MNTANINAELMQQFELVSRDEDLTKKVLAYIKRLTHREGKVAEDGYVPRTRDQIEADFNEAMEYAKLCKEGKVVPRSVYELINEL